MPQLDKVSFATQYFWLTLFFFGLYFLTANFFVILVFKNLRLRNMIYKIGYFFVYKFDYEAHFNKNKAGVNVCFNLVYYSSYAQFVAAFKALLAVKQLAYIANKLSLVRQSSDALQKSVLSYALSRFCSLTEFKEINTLNIDEI